MAEAGYIHELHLTGGGPESCQDPNLGEHDPVKHEECDPWDVPFGPGKAFSPLSGGILLSVHPVI